MASTRTISVPFSVLFLFHVCGVLRRSDLVVSHAVVRRQLVALTTPLPSMSLGVGLGVSGLQAAASPAAPSCPLCSTCAKRPVGIVKNSSHVSGSRLNCAVSLQSWLIRMSPKALGYKVRGAHHQSWCSLSLLTVTVHTYARSKTRSGSSSPAITEDQ